MYRIRTCLAIMLVLLAVLARAQKNIIELSPALIGKGMDWRQDSLVLRSFILDTRAHLPVPAFPVINRGNGIYLAKASAYHLLRWAEKIPGKVFIDEQVRPSTEAGVLNYDMTLNKVTTVWKTFPDINGKGETISIQEDKPDSLDPDLLGKYRPSALVSKFPDNHATIMATLALGSGNSSFRGKGVAYKASYSSTDFSSVLPAASDYYRTFGVQVQNHSYGTGIQNFYGVNARAFDLSTAADSTLLHVFSAGNSGTATSGQGLYATVTGMANITGNMKMAKNVLLAGAILDNGTIPSYSSKGPLYDGRIAPHLVALGDDGTSGAAAITSGTATLVQQLFKKINGRAAPSHLVKAVLVNGVKDIGTEGPDYTTGFGLLDAEGSLDIINRGNYFTASVAQGSTISSVINVPAGAARLSVTLAWTDSASASGAAKALVNDLDLSLLNLQTGEVFQPWVLSTFPQLDSLRKSARRGIDSINNLEQVSILVPAAGQYRVIVNGKSMIAPSISFSVAYSVSEGDAFRWTYPLRGDQLVGNEPFRLRWESTLSESMGKLEMSRDRGITWQLLTNNADLTAGSHSVALADSMLRVRFRISVPGRSFETADVISSPSKTLGFGYVCDTSLLTYWNRINGATSYMVYRMVNDTMKAVALTSDTFAISPRSGSSYFAVAGMLDLEEGIRGNGVDHRRQNAACYINSFVAALAGDKAEILLKLGTLFLVRKIEIYKVSDNDRILFSTGLSLLNEFTVADAQLTQGLNIYRARITLDNGTVLVSDEAVVYYLNSKSHIIFPNPAARGGDVYLLTENVDDEDADVYNMKGQHISHLVISEKQQTLKLDSLPKGSYLLRISKNGKTVQVLRFLLQ